MSKTELPFSAVTADPAQPFVDPSQPTAASSSQIKRPSGSAVEVVLDQITLPNTAAIGDVDATGIASRIIHPDGTQEFAAIKTASLNLNPFPLVDETVRHAIVDPTGIAFFSAGTGEVIETSVFPIVDPGIRIAAVDATGVATQVSPDRYAFPIVDPMLRSASVDATGIATDAAPDRNAFPLVDPAFAFAKVDATGIASDILRGDSGVARAAGATPIEWPYNLYVRLMKNQSLGNGYRSTPARLTTPQYGSLMLSCGVRTTYVDDYDALTLVPHVEAGVIDPVGNTPAGETSMRAAADRINELVASANGIRWDQHDFAVVSLVTGVSGSSIEDISPGTVYDNRARAALDRIFELAQGAGKSVGLASIPWMIGETNTRAKTPVATIIDLQEQNRAGLDAYVKSHWGQTRDVQTISYQTSSHSAFDSDYPYAAIAQWQASTTNPNFHVACPVYWADCDDEAHIYADDEDVIGAYMARVESAVILNKDGWKPLQPVSIEVQGRLAVAVFDVPVGPLTFDNDRVVDPGDYGLALYAPDGSRVALDAPPVISGKSVRFRSASMPAAVELRCGWLPGPIPGPTFVPSGRLTGPRCCLRDSAGDTDVYDPGGINRPLHNWCVISFVRSNTWPTN